MMKTVPPGLTDWLMYGERGVSSEAIVGHLVYGKVRQGFNDPSDPSDFRRCELLLRQVPLLRLEFPRMAEVSHRWAALVENWDKLAALLEEEVPDAWGPLGYRRGGQAPRTYKLMQNIEKKAA
ncbi:hypothetical protein QFZ79_002931 [Arthrobacter sp. V4I6]|uniref:hypothetical protein n=1 Tax=Arthrobacter sp. V4I6 TaxID=3042281 RepID=UPI002785FB7D|nr:hypothetical protein [Arthrobacter sp. V4I6]MDQ0854820.1 hypothetical protein [Arthrobacter sp. V4I6]